MSISPSSIHSIHSREDFLRFLSSELSWPIPDDLSFDDVTFDVYPDELGIRREDLRGSTIAQIRPFVQDQPWGIFVLQLQQPRLYLTELRRVLRALEPMKRKLKDFKTWNPQHVLFICTNDWKNYTFAHFEGEVAQKAKISTFGWEYQSDFIRTLCEFNIPHLAYPQESDLLGLDPKLWVEQWSSAFDVKKVTKKFYEEYDGIFKSIKQFLAGQFDVPAKLYQKPMEKWTEKETAADERLHLFVQNLVNRLMFLKFLEKRRWLDFNPNYLSDLYKRALSEKKNFYSEYLFYVFFAGLNRQVEFVLMKEGKAKATAQLFQERIGVLPFLNGGLFEKAPVDETTEISNEAFKELFDLFGRYNFTVNEDTPLDVEVAVNPEMLGKVFEESVIARKEKGAYYTPRNIVSFMCREALKNHLQSQCEIDNRHSKIENLVESHDASTLDAPDALELYKALYSIKVLDPAVGSGAFPVGMMFEILECYKAIGAKLEHDHPYLVQNRLANPRDVYKLKKQIIQNNLYGVDVEDFAVNIARLRFWLSLAVDFPVQMETREEFLAKVNEIEALPNLLYKIRQGDSLLAKYHGVSLELNERLSSGEFNLNRKKRISSHITGVAELKKTFYPESDSDKKKAIQRKIEGILRTLVAGELEAEIAVLKETLPEDNMFGMTKKERGEQERTQQEVERLEEVKKELTTHDALPHNFPMIWDVDFGEVLGEGGFDVVIANPPYVRQEEFKEIKEDLALHYECYTGTADLFTYFFERGVKLLKPGGTISYISSNKYFRAGYGAKLREFLTTNTTINALIDFGDLPVFEATAYPSVLVATRTTPLSPPHRGGETVEDGGVVFLARTVATEEELETFQQTFRASAITMKQSDLGSGGWRIEDRTVLDLLEKIKRAGVPLEEYVEGKIYRGITTGFNDAFVIDDDTRKQLIKEDKKYAEVIKPFLRGRDIKRYAIDDPNLWLIYVPWNFDTKKYPSIMRHLNSFKKELSVRPEVIEKRFPWYALSRYASDYWQEFENPKIISARFMIEPLFGYDTGGHYTNDACYIMPTKNVFLAGFLNSKLGWWALSRLTNQVQQNYSQIHIQYLTKLPIAKGTDKQHSAIEERVAKILKLKKSGKSTSELEKEIDAIVYEMYGLSKEEIKVVEGK